MPAPGGCRKWKRTPRTAVGILAVATVAAGLLIAAPALAKPEIIRTGHSYYSDSYEMQAGVAVLGKDMNYEEVYQFYNYYEAVYDEEERIVTFTAYKRGEWTRKEHYRYDDAGRAISKEVVHADGRSETLPLPAG